MKSSHQLLSLPTSPIHKLFLLLVFKVTSSLPSISAIFSSVLISISASVRVVYVSVFTVTRNINFDQGGGGWGVSFQLNDKFVNLCSYLTLGDINFEGGRRGLFLFNIMISLLIYVHTKLQMFQFNIPRLTGQSLLANNLVMLQYTKEQTTLLSLGRVTYPLPLAEQRLLPQLVWLPLPLVLPLPLPLPPLPHWAGWQWPLQPSTWESHWPGVPHRLPCPPSPGKEGRKVVNGCWSVKMWMWVWVWVCVQAHAHASVGGKRGFPHCCQWHSWLFYLSGNFSNLSVR